MVAWSNLVSAQGPLVLGLGLKGLGPGLDNMLYIFKEEQKSFYNFFYVVYTDIIAMAPLYV